MSLWQSAIFNFNVAFQNADRCSTFTKGSHLILGIFYINCYIRDKMLGTKFEHVNLVLKPWIFAIKMYYVVHE